MGTSWSGVGNRSGLVDRTPGGRWADLACLVALGVFWLVYVTPIVTREKLRGGDIFRDVAYAVNVQHGQVFTDPAYRGYALWYPPLSPVVMAGVGTLFHITPADAYRWSQLLFNWTIPAGMFLIMRWHWGRRAAMVGTVALLLAMPWWQSEVVQGQPSVQAVTWAWVALLLYGRQRRSGSAWGLVACGLFLGLTFWHHPVIPAVLALALVLQTIWEWSLLRSPSAEASAAAKRPLKRNLAIIALTGVAAAPILYVMAHGPVYNTMPREFLNQELQTVEFALMHGNPWIWITGLVGLMVSARQKDWGAQLLVSAVAVCCLGQVPAYLRLYGPAWVRSVPVLVPHEFQWTFQLAWAICVGVGTDYGLHALTRRWGFLQTHPRRVAVLTLCALVVTGMWGLPHAERNLHRFVHRYATNFPEAAAWIRENTDINDVFICDVRLAFAWLNPDTGRKVWITSPGHSNPRVDWKMRHRVLLELTEAATPEAFARLARRHGIKYCIPSPGWFPRILADPQLREVTVPAYLRPVYEDGKVAILEVVSRRDDLDQLEPHLVPDVPDHVQ